MKRRGGEAYTRPTSTYKKEKKKPDPQCPRGSERKRVLTRSESARASGVKGGGGTRPGVAGHSRRWSLEAARVALIDLLFSLFPR